MADTTAIPPGTPVGAQAPRQFGRYDVVGLIGEGAMGRVYRGFDPLANRPVAIKTIKREHLSQETTEKYIRRFRREAQSAGILSHPHIVGIFDVGDDYFVMELLTGKTLHELLAERGRLEPAEAVRILAPIADAVDHAHRNGIIHRDIKPANIMIHPDGRAKLMDFGVARLEDSASTGTGQLIGSPYYMAPEQMSGDEVVTARADTYSLAVVTYEALTGQRPFQADSVPAIVYKVVNENPQPPRKWNVDLPPVYDMVFARALSKDPMARPPSATDFMTALVPKDIGKPLASLFRPSPEAVPRPLVEGLGPDAGGATWDIPPAEIAAKAKETGPQGAVVRRLHPFVKVGAVLLALTALGIVARTRLGSPPPPAAAVSGLRVDSDPTGATIWMDGAEYGTSPRVVPDVRPGQHTVRLAAPGFADAELGIVVPADGKSPPLRFVLQPIAARVRIDSVPSGVAVSVDGEHTGMTPVDMVLLEPGRHEIRMDREGLRPWVKEVDARIGESFAVEARLQPVDTGSATGLEPTKPGMLISLGMGVTPPRKISGELAPYPEEARRRNLQGAVTVDMIITEDGAPIDVTVVESGGEVLNRALVDAVRAWRYEPARKGGVDVRVHWRVRQIFRLPST